MNKQEQAKANQIYYCRTGSHAYGLAVASSDEDFRGVFIGNPADVLGLGATGHVDYSGDDLLYELRKFLGLARDCNPNILELLFMEPGEVLVTSPYWERIVSQRDRFLSDRAVVTFGGYATAQIKKLRGHTRFLQEPKPLEKPEPARFLKVKYLEGVGMREIFDQLAYNTAVKHWQQYEDWKANRNVSRAHLEEGHGYDTKQAMHAIRLLRMSKEVLRGEGLKVRRADRDELLGIRAGALTYGQLTALAGEYQAEIEDLNQRSTLPAAPSEECVNQLIVSLYRDFWADRGLF